MDVQTLDEQRLGLSPRRQHAGNRLEPALPDTGPIALRAFEVRAGFDRSGSGDGVF